MIEKETRLQLAKDENDYNVWLNKYKIFNKDKFNNNKIVVNDGSRHERNNNTEEPKPLLDFLIY